MPDGHRVVVVGGGIVGAAAAFHLAEGGAEVVVVDDDREGRATYAGAGIVAWPWQDPVRPIFELRRRAVAAYTGLAARLGARLEVVGELFVAPPGRLLTSPRRRSRRAVSDRCGSLTLSRPGRSFRTWRLNSPRCM